VPYVPCPVKHNDAMMALRTFQIITRISASLDHRVGSYAEA